MSGSKSLPDGTRKRKPYKPPTFTKLTPEAAKAILEANSIPREAQAEKLLKEIRRIKSENK